MRAKVFFNLVKFKEFEPTYCSLCRSPVDEFIEAINTDDHTSRRICLDCAERISEWFNYWYDGGLVEERIAADL